MSRKIFILIFLVFLTSGAFAAKFSGANIPYDSSFHLGLASGPGTGINIGLDMFYPVGGVSCGIDIEQQVTNSEFEQNINILKYGLALKYDISEDLYLTAHIGKASFYLTKAVDYRDSFSGAEYSIDEDTRGNATYLAIAPNFRIGEYFLTPKIVLNNIPDGGTIAEFDLNLGHKF
jgi:hypothetical protein